MSEEYIYLENQLLHGNMSEQDFQKEKKKKLGKSKE